MIDQRIPGTVAAPKLMHAQRGQAEVSMQAQLAQHWAATPMLLEEHSE